MLRLYLDRAPLWRGEHVETGQLAEDFAQHLYLPRLRDDSVCCARRSRGSGRDLPDTLVCTITENCRTLGFATFELEKE